MRWQVGQGSGLQGVDREADRRRPGCGGRRGAGAGDQVKGRSRARIREVHPELLFWALNGRRAMVERKSRLSGYEERLTVLQQVFEPARALAEAALSRYRQSAVARDDLLDALVAAVIGYLSQGELRTIPEDVPRDAFGLPMEMVYYLP